MQVIDVEFVRPINLGGDQRARLVVGSGIANGITATLNANATEVIIADKGRDVVTHVPMSNVSAYKLATAPTNAKPAKRG